ncbi:hypothetical protein QUN99_003424 [Vibrio parahaemolyticus]|nr:hypothetical protein [Vibrio parahaemolyticus]
MSTIKPVIAIKRIMDTVWTLAFVQDSDDTVRIAAHTDSHQVPYEQEKLLPTFKLIEDEARTVRAITISKIEDGELIETRYNVSNQQFIFSYSQTVPEKMEFNENLDERCIIQASGAFLTEYLTKELLDGDELTLFAFIEEHKWEPVEDYEASQVWGFIEDHSICLKQFAQAEIEQAKAGIVQESDDKEAATLIEDTQNAMGTVASTIRSAMSDDADLTKPLYGVIWHYEGESPTLFTCKVSDGEQAEAMLHAELIDHESNKVDFHIDSVQRIEL